MPFKTSCITPNLIVQLPVRGTTKSCSPDPLTKSCSPDPHEVSGLVSGEQVSAEGDNLPEDVFLLPPVIVTAFHLCYWLIYCCYIYNLVRDFWNITLAIACFL